MPNLDERLLEGKMTEIDDRGEPNVSAVGFQTVALISRIASESLKPRSAVSPALLP